MRLDTERQYGYVRGATTGIRYEQDGHLFDAQGREVDVEGKPRQTQAHPAQPKAPETTAQERSIIVDDQPVPIGSVSNQQLREFAERHLSLTFAKTKSRAKMEEEVSQALDSGGVPSMAEQAQAEKAEQ